MNFPLAISPGTRWMSISLTTRFRTQIASQLVAVVATALRFACCGLVAGMVVAEESVFELAYTSNRQPGKTGIYLHTGSGGQLISTAASFAEAPSWAPHGRRLAFQARFEEQWDICIIDLDSNQLQKLTDDPHVDLHPTWSPDGTTIAFFSDRSGADGDSFGRIWLMGSDGTNLREFSANVTGIADFSWSPDGKKVAFCAVEGIDGAIGPNQKPVADLYIASSAGGNVQRITRCDSQAMTPSWSADGKKIAFALTTEPGTHSDIQIYVVNIDDTEIKKLTNIAGQNLCPKWFPDSSEVIFHNVSVSSSPPTERLMRVSADGQRTAVFEVGESVGYFPDIRRQSLTNR